MLTNRFVVNGFNRTRESGGEITPGGNGDMCVLPRRRENDPSREPHVATHVDGAPDDRTRGPDAGLGPCVAATDVGFVTGNRCNRRATGPDLVQRCIARCRQAPPVPEVPAVVGYLAGVTFMTRATNA
jgi:hypothetical protein